MNRRDPDRDELKRIVGRLYESVSSPPGVAPSVDPDAPHLHPRVRMCRTVRDAEGHTRFEIMSGRDYAENVRALVTEPGFFEIEVAHEAFVYGDVAHVLSQYEAFADAAHTRRLKKGVNSLQFLRVEGRWQVFSVVWDDEQNEVR